MASSPRGLRWLLAAALFATATAPARAASSTGASAATASLALKVVIPVVLRVHTVSQATHLSIAEPDVARGYVDIDGATRLRVTSNNPGGFVVSVQFDPAVVSRVETRMAGEAAQAPFPGASVQVPAHKLDDAQLDVAYRLYLAPGTRPGTYRWPVMLMLGAGA